MASAATYATPTTTDMNVSLVLNNDSEATNISTVNIILPTDSLEFKKKHDELMYISIWPLVFIFIFAVLGSIGNSIVIYVYWSKWKRNKTRVFILCLGVLDLMNCLFNMPVEIAILWRPLTFDMHYLCKLSRGSTYVINNTGSLVFVSIAIERYLLVYYPLRYRQLTPKFAKLMCLAAFIISSCVSWPTFIFYGTNTSTISLKSTTSNGTHSFNYFVTRKTCLIADEHKIRQGLILIFTIFLIALLILTFIVLSALYIAIGRKIYMATCTDLCDEKRDNTTRMFSKSIISALTGGVKATNSAAKFKRQSSNIPTLDRSSSAETTDVMNNSHLSPQRNCIRGRQSGGSLRVSFSAADHGETGLLQSPSSARMSRKFSSVKARPTRKNTIMMRMVTIAFMLSFTPFLVILIIRYTNPMYYSCLNIPAKIAYSIFLRSYFINSMINPFIYGFMNMTFRDHVKQLFMKLFCSKCCKRDSDKRDSVCSSNSYT